MRNDSLEERISVLEINPSKKLSGSGLSPRQEDLSQVVSTLNSVVPSDDSDKETKLFAGGCNLQFDAVVTALNGKNKEAFYTEFFIIDEDVESVLKKGRNRAFGFLGDRFVCGVVGSFQKKLVFVSKRAKEHPILAFEIG